jgi:membrane fusion protein (multidrug efflux system)
VPERYAADVTRGARVTVEFEVLNQTYDAELSYVGAAVDPRSRTFPVEFRIPNPEGTIKPEMVAKIGLVRSTIDAAYVVPEEALVRVEDGFVAFVVTGPDGSETVEARRVVRGPSQQNQVVVEEGLSAGDRLVVRGQQQVAEGDRVRVVGR